MVRRGQGEQAAVHYIGSIVLWIDMCSGTRTSPRPISAEVRLVLEEVLLLVSYTPLVGLLLLMLERQTAAQ